ncbi:MAG: 6-bladed beta-propeller [Acidobacteriota bacterium]|nr:6-bladed beta-propeller [Acidobacteriota bacterium]
MFFWMLMTVMLEGGPLWHVTDTEIYSRLSSNKVKMARDGRVYVLDGQEKKIHIYGADGKLIKSFGEAGKGPGEMTYPFELILSEDALYVRDFGNVAVIRFDLDGNFVSQAHMRTNITEIVKVKGGWFYGTWRFSFGRKDPGVLYWADENMENETEVLNLRPEGFKSDGNDGFVFKMGEAMALNPAEDNYHLVADTNGARAYLSHPGPKLKISVFDTESKSVLTTYTADWKRTPFNTDWGNALIERTNSKKPPRGLQLKFKADFPEYFPLVHHLEYWNDRLYVWRWKADPGKGMTLSVLDKAGKEIAADLPDTVAERLGGVVGGNALVLTFDGEEEAAGFALCPLTEVAAFVKANPIPEEESRGVVVIAD